ncbi:B-box-type zinc finger [Parasponia andersonii]|uniref:B-box-type zinc finger n=1 Tax=Parasponia andersonii TaxID=3476 RepID=A0A2P5D6E0_PARAD|nr:B-box-type zinc finger [Parasponia andersonii]
MAKNSQLNSSEMFSLCDFCNSKAALLYCDADSANLCLFCDRHVHSANALSIKHSRSWICHSCGHNPVSLMCSKKKLLLCHDCFSGCPSATGLASILGLSLEPENLMDLSSGSGGVDHKCLNLQGSMVSSDMFSISSGQSLSCGKRRKELCEQLIEMGRRDLLRVDVDVAEMRRRTPPSGRSQQENIEGLEQHIDGLLRRKTLPFTSLLVGLSSYL